MHKSVIFLHIPKTAGQSVHSFLTCLFKPEEMCPARENFQLLELSIAQLRQYRLFSGHLDYSLLDAVAEPRFVFTILRRPLDRLLSFYFYLRSKGAKLSAEELTLSENKGMHAALTLPPDKYFCGGSPSIRRFLDTHYDNFYTYYFAGRTFDGRQKLIGAMRRSGAQLNSEELLRLAFENIETLNAVYTTDELHRLEAELVRELGVEQPAMSLVSTRVNAGEVDASSRLEKLREFGATERTFERLQQMTAMDDRIWEKYAPKSTAAQPGGQRVAMLGG